MATYSWAKYMVYDQMNKLFHFVSICETVSCTHAMPLVLCAIHIVWTTCFLSFLHLTFEIQVWHTYIHTSIHIFVTWHIDTKASNQSVPIKYAHKTNGFWRSGKMAVVVVETEYEKSDRHADRYETCLHPYTVYTLHFYSGFNCTLAWTYRDKKFWVL